MKSGTTFYLSRLLGNTVFSVDDAPIGKLRDVVVDLNAVRPRVIAIKVKLAHQTVLIDYSRVSITKVNNQYRIQCEEVKEIALGDDTLYLVKGVLDKQIVDMYGRKVVRVNDVRLAALSGGTYLVAVDVGFEGFLRRLGVAKPLKRLLKPIHVNISSNLLLWDEVETIDTSNQGIKLSNTFTKLSTLHPSDLADILEDLDRKTQMEIFSSLDKDKAADVLEELEPEAQVTVVENMTVDEAAQVLEKLPADEAADILDELEEDRADQILLAMDAEASDEIRDLMEYPEDSVGSLMTTDFVALSNELRVQEAIETVRGLKPDAESAHYPYVVDDVGRLLGTVSLRDLIIGDPNLRLDQVMNSDVLQVSDNEDIDELVEKMCKYSLVSMPVVNDSRELIGMVLLTDVMDTLLKPRRGRH